MIVQGVVNAKHEQDGYWEASLPNLGVNEVALSNKFEGNLLLSVYSVEEEKKTFSKESVR